MASHRRRFVAIWTRQTETAYESDWLNCFCLGRTSDRSMSLCSGPSSLIDPLPFNRSISVLAQFLRCADGGMQLTRTLKDDRMTTSMETRQLSDDDRRAFHELYQKHHHLVYSICL